jgi:WD40 repeat protein
MAGFLSSDHPPPAHWPTFSPDETALATQGGDGAVWLWDPATRKQKTRLAPANRDFGLFIGFGANSRTVVTATSGNVQVWDADTAKETQMPGSYLAKVSPDGKSMVTVGPDGTVYRIDLAGDQPRSIARLASAGGLAFSPDGTTLAMGSGDGTVELYDWTTLKQRSRLPGNAMQTLELAFSPDGTILAARYGNTDRSGALKTAEVRFWQVATGQEKGLPRHMADAMAFAPDGQTFVTTEPDGAMNCWDPATTDRRYRIPPIIGSRLFRIVFSPDGKTVLSPGLGLRGSVNLRDVATGQIVAVLSGHFGPVVDGCFSADGQTLVTTTSGGVGEIRQRQAEVRIWKRIR